MANTRVSNTFGDIAHEQLAQSGRTQFTPGKASSRANDQNWPKDFKVPTGNPNFENGGDAANMKRQRMFRTGRGSVCDQAIANPNVTHVEVGGGGGDGISGQHSYNATTTQQNDGRHEDRVGQDYPDE
jgi:hypothetical protein